MIRKLKALKILPLKHISPSQYYSALNCPYKLVLANTFKYESLLPINANAHFGSIAHKMIELISRGIVVNEESFSECWNDLINKKENELRQKGLGSITPLKYFVSDFALKKNQLRHFLERRKNKIAKHEQKTTNTYFPEVKLTNLDHSIYGIADLIIKNGSSVVILDFKTGKVHIESIDENGGSEKLIKKEYELQLKLYAYLYFLMHNVFPTSLFLITLDNNFIEVPFTQEDCENVYKEAVSFLSSTNSIIEKQEFELIAKPSKENCQYCSYRPACNYYSNWLTKNFEHVNDLGGLLKKVNCFNNNSLGLQMQIGNHEVLINGLTGSLKQGFENLIDKKITLYNLRKSKNAINATANIFTITYA
ncbi:hypothetical protein A4H97_33310 [Niastella yeongjuensis]|uniref:PD-(D/E)XK endonuclease-like domain-containing protein n=1 Tax=Niastella yeongjuensis TaxID=354355 RepID=A0A1V9EE48_9BACT|nr:PD-(D/E)XK nuclease family protein [Niastella yeongjuensis]OQP44234.1 hypothetical protein A4H97_33310 [Niastella yeongjuensis]SEO40535.1 RecB family exonuclease [Niastella yeongjuensis]